MCKIETADLQEVLGGKVAFLLFSVVGLLLSVQ
jgi:hypothetical protein